MKFTILLDILFELLKKRKLTAKELAEKYNLSPRTVYRYVTLLSKSVPLSVTQGRNGGIRLSDCYKLPVGFLTEEEYRTAIEALDSAYAQTTDERFLRARRKLSAQEKSEKRSMVRAGESELVYVDDVWSALPALFEKLTLLNECIRAKTVLEIQYRHPSGEMEECRIEPHALTLQNNVWQLYAFCYGKRTFRAFAVGRTFSIVNTRERFLRRKYERADLPVQPPKISGELLAVKFEISESALENAAEWFGLENVYTRGEKGYAEVLLADDEKLVVKILKLGSGVKVLSPNPLRERIAQAAKELLKTYS